jgi:O-antigen/teichoic acid export membrane protein
VLNYWTKLANIRGSSLARNTVWMIAGLGGNSLVQAGAFLLLARLLGVAEYGVFAGAFALVSTFTPYSSLGSQMTFMRYVSTDRGAAQIHWGNMVAITAATTVLLAAGLAVAGAKLLGPGSMGMIAVLVVSNCFMGQITNNASIVFQTFERMKETSWLRVLSNLLRLFAIAGLMLYLKHATALQCSFGILVSSTLAALIAFIWVRSVIGHMRISSSVFRKRFWEGIGFSVAGSTTAVYNDVDKMMLSHYGMNTASGIYTLAYRVVDFATIPVNAIDTACLPRYFVLSRDGLTSVSRLARKIVPLGALSGLVAGGLTLLAAPFFVHIVGHGFGDSLLAIRWLCWLPALRGVHQLAGGVLTATGRQNYRTAAQFLIAALNLVLNLIWIPTHGWLGAAWASLASDGALGILNLAIILLLQLHSTERDPSNTIQEFGK